MAIVQLDSGERELIPIRHLVWEGTQVPVTEQKALAELDRLEAPSELKYNSFSQQDLSAVQLSSPAVPQKVEVNTNDILIAFISNLDCMSEAQVEAVGKELALRCSEKASVMLRAIAQVNPNLIANFWRRDEKTLPDFPSRYTGIFRAS